MNKLFLDSANLEEIELIAGTIAIDGVTTNPSLIAKEQKADYKEHLRKICQILHDKSFTLPHLSVEVITLDPKEIEEQAESLYNNLSEFEVDVHIKIPVSIENLSIISRLEYKNVKVNATACMTADQAKMAMDAGASIVSFFYNRMIDGGLNANMELNRFATFRNQKSDSVFTSTQVICGSIRQPQDVLRCWENGADIVTASMKVIKSLMHHPKTDEAVANFQKDIDTWLK